MSETRVLVVGAGTAGQMVVVEMRRHPEAGRVPVAFVDDDPAKQGTEVLGVMVLGGRHDIPRILASTRADEILIALPSVHGGVIRDIIAVCRTERVSFRVVPGIWEIIRGDVRLDHVRRLEPEDLLGRETVEPDPGILVPAYEGKRILVTGGGGSIGRELAHQALALGPEKLVLLGRGENSLFESELSLRRGGRKRPVELVLADLRDAAAVRRAFEAVRPQVVLHAAAHKHVSFMERYPEEAVTNNIVATRDLMDAAEASGVERFVMLSTDKAVNPRSVMGASKRVAELLLGERHAASSPTRFMAVRFGNVLGSRGSVVPLFLHQIRAGGPVTVSDPEVARYFMSVKEAAVLVLEAGAIGVGGEVFILDMGEQLSILDLARDLIILSGHRPGADIEIVTSGLGPGEKVREELVHRFEELTETRIPKIRAAGRVEGEHPLVSGEVDALAALAREADRRGIVAALTRILPEADLRDWNPDPSGAGGPGRGASA